ncbi:MAG TPA: hypothetical protein VLB80_01625 [Candidatus Babeliales bacterium]|nr:hypothetical protein [Candidatus Babeliales bacterium]
MKKSIIALCFVCICACLVVSADELLTEYEKCLQITKEACCKVIDEIFMQAQESIAAKEDITNNTWFERKEIIELRNCISDADIIAFDNCVENVISQSLEKYLQKKTRDEVKKIFDCKDSTINEIKQLFSLSKIVCELTRGTYCHRMIKDIKDENWVSYKGLKSQNKIKRQIERDEVRRLHESIIVGLRK